jgi:hypothetical protein
LHNATARSTVIASAAAGQAEHSASAAATHFIEAGHRRGDKLDAFIFAIILSINRAAMLWFRVRWTSESVEPTRSVTTLVFDDGRSQSLGRRFLAIMGRMTYHHTQRGRWHYLLLAFAAATLAGSWIARSRPPLDLILCAIAAIFAFCGLIFGSLTVSDEGQWLAVRFGPLPLVGKSIRFADITGIEIGRTSFVDGWGVHYVPGRGWTYNIWGFSCVKLTLGRKLIRIGTDDAEGLAKFLWERTGLPNPTESDGMQGGTPFA